MRSYGENHYPAPETLREAHAALHLLAGDAPRVLARLAAQEAHTLHSLTRVYERGVRGWRMGHTARTTAEQWGVARVLEFVQGGAAARTCDRDLTLPANVNAPVHVEVTVAPNSVGVMLPIPLAVAQKYALDVEGAEPPAEFHMTLVYLGKLLPETITAVREAVRRVAAQFAPFEGKISGIGRFNGPETDPLYLSVDAVKLTAFREAIFNALPPTEQRHGFTPHVTLAYLPKTSPTPMVPIHDDVIRFDRVEVWIGGKREPYLLTGKAALEYRSEAELAAADAAKAAMQQWLADQKIQHVTVGVGIGSDQQYRVEVRVYADDVDTSAIPAKMRGVRVNVVRMPFPSPTVGHPDAGASAADKGYISTLIGQVEEILREADETPVCSHAKEFHRLVNMSPAEIRKWSKDPRAKCASFPSTLRRLPALAALKEKPVSSWTKRDCAFAARVVSFNSRMDGMRQEHGNTDKINVSLRNWGRAVGNPPAECPKDTKHKKK
jgi:2'-5' RNA ligase